jgi:serine/threonine protein kinase
MNPKNRKNVLKDKFKEISAPMFDLLKGLLQFNPNYRLSAAECLKMKVFDEVRLPDPDLQSPKTVFLDIDQPNQINYKKPKESEYTLAECQA